MANVDTVMNIRNTQEGRKLLSTSFRDVNQPLSLIFISHVIEPLFEYLYSVVNSTVIRISLFREVIRPLSQYLCSVIISTVSGVPRGFRGFKLPPKFRRPSKIVEKLNLIVKTVKDC